VSGVLLNSYSLLVFERVAGSIHDLKVLPSEGINLVPLPVPFRLPGTEQFQGFRWCDCKRLANVIWILKIICKVLPYFVVIPSRLRYPRF
jgi:hypothetical protein